MFRHGCLRPKTTNERNVTPLGFCDSLYGTCPSLLWIICFLLFLHSACAQNDTFEIVPSTIQPVQCGSYWFFWIGGTPPFEMQVGTIDNTQHIDTTFGIEATSWLWEPVDLLAGTHLVLMLTDSTGRQTIDTSWAVVRPSDDDSCLPEDEQGRSTVVSSSSRSTSVSSSATPPSTSSTPPPTTTSESSPTTTARTTRRTSTLSTSSASASSSSSHLLPTGAVANPSTSSRFSATSSTSSPQSTSNSSHSASSISTHLLSPSPSAATDSATGQKSMGSGAIAGIAVGAVAAILLALAALLWCLRRRKRASSPAMQRPEDLSDVDPFSAFPSAPSPRAKRAMSPFMYDRSSSTMSPFRAASPSMSTPTPSVFLLRDHAGSSTFPQDGSMQATHPAEFSPYAAYAPSNGSDTMLPRPLRAKTSMGQLSPRSHSITPLLSDQTPRSAVFPGGFVRSSHDLQIASDDMGSRVTATDGGVRLAGGPPGEAPHAVSARGGEMFPPPYDRY